MVNIGWKIKNLPNLMRGMPGVLLAELGGKVGLVAPVGRLYARKVGADGSITNYGLIGTRVVTTAFCEFMVDQLIAEGSTWGDFKYHDSGTGITAENATDTGMETESTVQTDDLRAVGTQVEGTSVQYRSVGTITYDGSAAITEHGLFNNTRVGGGTLMDRTVFSAINVASGDSIQFTYTLTCTAGS